MQYREHRVQPTLDALVECVWFLTTGAENGGNAADDAGTPQRILPDGCVELVCHFSLPFLAISSAGPSTALGAGARTPQAACFVVGMLTSPFVVEPAGQTDTMGVRFRPGGAYPFLSCPLFLLADRAIGLEDLWGRAAPRLWEQLATATGDEARVRIVSRALLERLVRVEADRVTASAVGDLVKTAGRASIAAVAERAGVTTRHLQRRFEERVGVSPKVLARILRFQNTLRKRAAAGGVTIDWVRVAVECGYADQSHLIHDYAAFAGQTPVSLLAAESELSTYFTAPQRLAALFGARR